MHLVCFYMIQLIFCSFCYSLGVPVSLETLPKDIHIHTQDLDIKTPLGDGVNTAVYDFIKEALLKTDSVSPTEITDIQTQEEDALGNKELKAPSVSLAENQLSHVLSALCQADKHCCSIYLYQKDGLALALADSDNLKHTIQTLPSALIQKKLTQYLNKTYITLPFPQPSELGVKILFTHHSQRHYEALGAIYYHPLQNVTEIVFNDAQNTGECIGFVKYRFVVKF